MIKATDIAWAAGIYEGEGNFSGDRILIAQKDPWLLYKLTKLFGFGNVLARNGNGFGWCVSGMNARGFILTIFTFLSPRRKAEILEHKRFFIDANFKCQNICRNGHVKTPENTRRKYNYRRKNYDLVCLNCQRDRSKSEWQRQKTRLSSNV